jgi:hypothetical protein
MRRVALPLLLWSAAAWPGAASAHHSFAAIYDLARDVTLRAVVREFRFVNPHPTLIVDVRGSDGATQSWQAEMDNRHELVAIGVTPLTFKPGDVVVVSGSPGRAQTQIMYLWKLERPADGLRYKQVGMTPYLSFP